MLAFLDPKWGLILVCFHLFLFHHQQDNTCLWRVSPENPPELESFSRGDIGIWCNRSYTKARCEEFISLSGNTTWRRRFLDSRWFCLSQPPENCSFVFQKHVYATLSLPLLSDLKVDLLISDEFLLKLTFVDNYYYYLFSFRRTFDFFTTRQDLPTSILSILNLPSRILNRLRETNRTCIPIQRETHDENSREL